MRPSIRNVSREILQESRDIDTIRQGCAKKVLGLLEGLADSEGMNLGRILKAAGQDAPASKPILEINPHHPAVLRLKDEDRQFDDWAAVLFDQARQTLRATTRFAAKFFTQQR